MKRTLTLLLAVAGLAVPASAQAASAGQFTVACSYHHMLMDDPIVFPGQAGMSHSHDFAGASSTNAGSTAASLLGGGTTCSRPMDHSAYWVPTLLQNGKPVHAREFRAYYRGSGFDRKVVRPFPKGLQIIAGNSKVTDAGPYQPVSIASWACTIPGGGAAGDEVEVESVPSTCGGQPLRARIVFPQCWNGRDLDSADHKSHMAYAVHGKCPATHPVVLPQLTLSIRYWVPNTDGLALASGGTHSLHADFMLAWPQGAQEDLVKRCINAGANCGTDGPATVVSRAAGVVQPRPSRPRRSQPRRSRPRRATRWQVSRAALCLLRASRSPRHR
jgi:hypothetical protein